MSAQLREPAPMPAGLYFGESEAVYHADRDQVLSCSAIKQLLRSPAHYRAWASSEIDASETPAQRFGKAFHCALLEPERFARDYVTLGADAPRRPSVTQLEAKKPSEATVAAIQFWDSLERSGRRTLSGEDSARIAGMLASVQSQPWAARLVANGRAEVTLRWTDEASGLRCKARADYFVDTPATRYVLDVKTCTDASPEGFAAACARYAYHLQHAHYCDGFRALGLPLASYFLLAIESEAPYVCQPYALDAAAEVAGFGLRERAAALLARCIESDRWPGYSDDLPTLSLPAWAIRNQEQTA